MLNTRLKKIRALFGLTQAKFAQKIHRSGGYIGAIEAGKINASDATISTICEIYHVNEQWIRTGIGDMFEPGFERAQIDTDNACHRVRIIRKSAKLTQDEFAKEIGYSKVHVHLIETGTARPSNEFLQKVATRYGVNYDWLLTGIGEQKADPSGEVN